MKKCLILKGLKSLQRYGLIKTLGRTAYYSISKFKIRSSLIDRMTKKLFTPSQGATNRSEVFDTHNKLIAMCYPPPSEFAISHVSISFQDEIKKFIDNDFLHKISVMDLAQSAQDHFLLLTDKHSHEVLQTLDRNITVIDLHKLDTSHPLIEKLHSEIRANFQREIGSPFCIVNTRMWTSAPKSERFGPNAFHTDGFEPGHLKVMVYLTPLDEHHGFLQLKRGDQVIDVVDYPQGTAVLFQNSELEHSGVPGTIYYRTSIEVTIMRSSIDFPQVWPGHFFGRHLIEPTIFHHLTGHAAARESSSFANSVYSEDNTSNLTLKANNWHMHCPQRGLRLNVGSGRRDWHGWVCLDEIEAKGVTRINFHPDIVFPLNDSSSSLSYSSHCFEHLDIQTIRGVFRELRRVSLPKALFLLKIPDYDYFLRQYRKGIETSMNDKGVESVVHTWKDRTEDTFINRLSMMFCGYWNVAYGDHFSGNINEKSDAYHGPAILPLEELQQIFSLDSPSEICRRLRSVALSDPNLSRFNHQSAWSREEMNDLLENEGFKILSNESSLIVKRFGFLIPDLRSMESFSAYYLAELS